jgi:hypothetical protein
METAWGEPIAGEPRYKFFSAHPARQAVGISVGIGGYRRQKSI